MPKQKLTYEYVKEQIEKEGYTLLSKEYINARSKLKVKCSENHIYKTTWNNFQQGKKCSYCFGNSKLKYLYIKEQIEKYGYELISKYYINSHCKIKIKCNKGHEYKTEYDKFNQGCRCPICDYEKTSSRVENKIYEFIKSFDLKIIKNDRSKIINPITKKHLELDIFIPKLKKAIEFNGKYWHSFKYSKIKDSIKKKQCEEKGINLLVIDEEDWIENEKKCLSKINNFIIK